MASRKPSDPLIYAIQYVLWANLSMGDSLRDLAEYLADAAQVDYTWSSDFDKVLLKAIAKLIETRSDTLVDFLEYYFTDEVAIETIFDDFTSSTTPITSSIMYMAINTIYDRMSEFPDGVRLQDAIQENVFNQLESYSIDAAKVGYEIGHLYWEYINNPDYGPKINDSWTVGSASRDTTYAYHFIKTLESSVSSEYYCRLYPEVDEIPSKVGFNVQFRESGVDIIADIYLLAWRHHYLEDNVVLESPISSDDPVDSIVISDFSADGIDIAAHQIADWLDSHTEYALENGISL